MEKIKHTCEGFECEIILAEHLEKNRRKVYTVVQTDDGKWMKESIVANELIEHEPKVNDYLCQMAISYYRTRFK